MFGTNSFSSAPFASVEAGWVLISGSQAVAAQGSFTPGTSVTLGGQYATADIGGVGIATSVTLTGSASIIFQGNIGVSLSSALAGISATFDVGYVYDCHAELDGHLMTSGHGYVGIPGIRDHGSHDELAEHAGGGVITPHTWHGPLS